MNYKVYFHSPVGILEISSSETAIQKIDFVDYRVEYQQKTPEVIMNCVQQLSEYFDGKRKTFDLPIDLKGTPFQKKVWSELLKVDFGKTSTYQHISIVLGDKNLNRAVGNANSKNPIPIIIPCHRIIGKDGTLVGYSGKLWRKKWLLSFEDSQLGQALWASER